MPRGFASLAEYYRAHREEMELARATGCTPVEARRELRRRAKARRASCGTRAPDHSKEADSALDADAPAGGDFASWDAGWMMRD